MKTGLTVCSPFFGGGSVELELAARGHNVIGTDAFLPVAVFWQQLKKRPKDLHSAVQAFLPGLDREEFKSLQSELRSLIETSGDPLRIASVFFVLNRCSFSGSTLSGGMSPGCSRFTASAVDRLLSVDLSRVEVRHGDYWDALMNPALGEKWDVSYCDPPYYLEGRSKLYGDRGDMHSHFDHQLFSSRLNHLISRKELRPN